MFDLDAIEKDWLDNSIHLTERDVIEIFRSEEATLRYYKREVEKWFKETRPSYSAEERLLLAIFGEKYDKDKYEEWKDENKLRNQIPFPEKKHLSVEAQNKVVEGRFDLVFEFVRKWDEKLNGFIPLEDLYNICVDSLMISAKCMCHCERPVFGVYVGTVVERNVISYISRKIKMPFREVKDNLYANTLIDKLNKEDKEILKKPSELYYEIQNEVADIDYIRDISNEAFLKDYEEALDELFEIQKMVMKLCYDADGYKGLTLNEIADFLGITYNKVYTIKRRTVKMLRKNEKLKSYLP